MRVFSQAETAFIQENLHRSPAELMLQASRHTGLSMAEMVQQIQARQKAATKLPSWAASPDAVFPSTLSVEQTSSEQTAAFKASLTTGDVLVDLTGGFGVDSYYFSKKFKQVVHIEQQTDLSEIATHNFRLLRADNIQTINTTAEEYLASFEGLADVIFLDPARRGEHKEKVHLLQDSQPDVLQLLPLLLSKSKAVLLKTSPMLDIDLALEQLRCVTKVWVVAVQNECKEVLYLLNHQPTATVVRTAVNLSPKHEVQQLQFTKEEEDQAKPDYLEPQLYIYEPNAAVLKAGAYKFISLHFQAGKLHPNSHLYTSKTLIPDFPGRSFRCITTCSYKKQELLSKVPSRKANITVRNFPESVASIRKKTGLKEGGEQYLFFTTDRHQKPIVLICEKA